MEKGLIQVYTGNGKGKTTASAGLAVRARSRGLRVLFVQFMKDDIGGESDLLKDLSVDVRHFEGVLSPHFHPEADPKAIRKAALAALESIKPVLKDFDLAVLDEFNCLLLERVIKEDEAVEFLRDKPEALELVLTGRGATKALMEAADLVVEMKDVKHPSKNGLKARKGIEY